MHNSRPNKSFFLAIVLLHLFYFLWQVLHANYLLTDSFEYLQAAANLKSDFLLYSGDLSKPIVTELFTRRPPIYPLFLAACQMISPGFILVILLQNIFSITGIYLVRQIILEYGYSTKYDTLFIVLLAFTPSQFIYTNLIMSETLFQFLIILLVWFFIKYLNERHYYYGLLYSAVLALSVLTKPVLVYFVFVNILIFIWLSIKRMSVKPILIGLIPMIVLLSYQYRNYRQTGVFETSGIVTTNLLDFNIYYLLVKTDGVQKADSTISAINGISALKGSYKEKVAFKKQQLAAIVLKRPVSYFILHARGMVAFFLDPGRFDLVNFFNLNAEKINGLLSQINEIGFKSALTFLFKHSILLLFLLAAIFLLNIFKLLCFIRFIFQRNINRYVKSFILLLIFYLAFFTGSLGLSRYIMPLVPIYIGCCLLFQSHFLKESSENVWKNFLHALILKSPVVAGSNGK
jgi:hypothetical protein